MQHDEDIVLTPTGDLIENADREELCTAEMLKESLGLTREAIMVVIDAVEGVKGVGLEECSRMEFLLIWVL